MADLIAKEIVKQIGGINRLVAMTGAYDFVALKSGVAFKIKNAKANYIKINLTSADLYDLEVGRMRKGTYTVVKEEKGLYADMLKPSIEKATGMYLSLSKGGKLCKKDEGVSIMLEDGGGIGFENKLWNNVVTRSMSTGGKLESDWVVEFLRKDSNDGGKIRVDVKANSYSSAKAKACIKTGFLPKNYNFNIYEKKKNGGSVGDWTKPKHLGKQDWSDLSKFKALYDKKEYERAYVFFWQLDTIVRDEVPKNISSKMYSKYEELNDHKWYYSIGGL